MKMNRKFAKYYDIIMYSAIALTILFWVAKAESATKYCSDHYCAFIPEGVVAINKNNWGRHENLIPNSIKEKLANGSTRELWVFKEDSRISVAVDYRVGRIRIDEPLDYCDQIKEKLGDPITSCGHVFPERTLKGLQVISWTGDKKISFIRIFMPLNGGSVYFVCTGRWKNRSDVDYAYKEVVKIIHTMKIKK